MPTAKSTYHFVGPREWVNGVKEWFSGMASTTLYVQQAKAFISRAAAADKPFFAFVPVVAPHIGAPHDDYPDEPGKTTWVPPEFRYTAPRTGVDDPSVNEADVSDKPGSIADKPRLTPRQLDAIAERDAQRTEALEGADRDVASLIEQLDFLGVLDDTYVILASDNGFMQGQHRIQVGKDQPYEPAAHVPLIIRGTGFPVGSRYGRVTGLQDITPTILSMTHERATAQVDGLSLLDLVDGARTPSKRPQLIEIPVTARFSDNAIQAGANVSPAEARRLEPVSWHARGLVTTSGWKYIEYPQSGEAELYDLNDDPYELRNLAGDPDFSVKVARMSSRLHQWWHCDGKACG
jgi:arylsulfatase A-like enzyme